MYIPAEAIYYEIINHLDREYNIMSYAWSNKIIITSPNTLFLTLRIIEHWYQDTKLSEETHNIIKRLNLIIKDAKTLDESFKKLGKHLSDTNSAFESSQKRLELMNKKATKLVDFNEAEKNDSKALNNSEE
jgi:DNA recombination protein RmuC